LINIKLKEQIRFYLFIILALFIHLSAFAQESSNAVLSGKIIDTLHIGIKGVLIELKQNDKVISSVFTAQNGKFPTINIPIGEEYTLVISKENYITKTLEFDLIYNSTECEEFFKDIPILPLEINLNLDLMQNDKNYPDELFMSFINGRIFINDECHIYFDTKLSEEQRAKYNSWVK